MSRKVSIIVVIKILLTFNCYLLHTTCITTSDIFTTQDSSRAGVVSIISSSLCVTQRVKPHITLISVAGVGLYCYTVHCESTSVSEMTAIPGPVGEDSDWSVHL